jgi:hypothetical protein
MIPIQFAWSLQLASSSFVVRMHLFIRRPLLGFVAGYQTRSAAGARCFPGLSGPGRTQRCHPTRDGDDALGHVSVNGLVVLPQNIRNTSPPHWRGWLKPESRCSAPANSFAEYAPDPNPATKKDVV